MGTSVEPIAIVKREKAGRPATEDSRGTEIKRKLAEWRLTPPHLREPQTVAALARELNVSRSLVNYYDKRTPQSPQDFIEACERNTLGKYYPQALDAIARKAAAGNVEAFKALAKTTVEPRRPQAATTNSMYADSALNKAIRELVQPSNNGAEKTLSIKAEKTTLQIEAKPVETTNSVQLPAHVESITYEK